MTSSSGGKGPRYPMIALLSLGHMVTDINQGAVPALLPFLIAEYQLSYAAAAAIVFASTVASTVVQPLFGHLADRASSPYLMPLGIFFAGLGLGTTGIVSDYRLVLAGAMVSGIGIAAFHPDGARLVTYAAADRKASAMSIFGVGGTVGFAVGPLLVTAALLAWGLRGTLILILPVTVMAVILLATLLRERTQEKGLESGKASATPGTEPDAWGPFLRLSLAVVGRAMLFYGFNTFIPLYWINVLHRSKAAGATALAVFACSTVLGNLLGGRLADRFGHKAIILGGFLPLIPLILALVFVKDPAAALALLVPVGMGMSLTYSPMVVLGQRYLPNHIGLSSGVSLGMAIALGGVSAPILGRIGDIYGLSTTIAVMAFIPVMTAGVALTLPRPETIRHKRGNGL